MTIEEKARAYDEALEIARKSWLDNQEPGYKRYRELLESMFPELRESEDERMRKAALEGIEYLERKLGWDFIGDTDILDVKEYLEKQKEQKPVQEKLSYEEIVRNAEEEVNVLYPNNEEEGTEAWERRECLREHYMKGAVQAAMESLGIKEQKPVISDEAIREGVAHFGITQYQIDNWLKKHINVIEQKPVEWSEEDENTRHNIIARLESLLGYETQYLAKAYLQKEISWLKSLRPSWKPSEDEMAALKEASARWMNEKMGNAELLQSLYDGLKKNAL